MDEASPDLTVPWGDHPKDRLSLFIREIRSRPDQLVQAFILHRGGDSISDTLVIPAGNRP